MIKRISVASLLLAASIFGQYRVDSRNTYSRIACVVPLVGSGTAADPKRPQYAPWPPPAAGTRTGIIGFSFLASDDGKFALVEFVARDRSAFQAILNDKTLKIFEKGKDKLPDIEAAFKLLKKDFDISNFGTVMP